MKKLVIGLVAGAAVAAVVAIFAVAGLVQWLLAPEPNSGETLITDLRAGDCLERDPVRAYRDEPGGSHPMIVVGCSDPHEAQIMAVVDVREVYGEYPGDMTVYAFLSEVCRLNLGYGIGYNDAWLEDKADLGNQPLPPIADSWESDGRGLCLTTSLEGSDPLTRDYLDRD